MNKKAMKISGIITVFMYVLLLVFAVFFVTRSFNVDMLMNLVANKGIITKIFDNIYYIFIDFPLALMLKFKDIPTDMPEKVLSVLYIVFCLIMLFWGFKEIGLSHKDDEDIFDSKKSYKIMNFLKFLVFLYFGAFIVCHFLLEEFKFFASNSETLFGFPFFIIIAGVLGALTFICVVFFALNLAVVCRAVKKGDRETREPKAKKKKVKKEKFKKNKNDMGDYGQEYNANDNQNYAYEQGQGGYNSQNNYNQSTQTTYQSSTQNYNTQPQPQVRPQMQQPQPQVQPRPTVQPQMQQPQPQVQPQYTPMSMQANMPRMAGYQPQYQSTQTQPAPAQPTQNVDDNTRLVVPGRDGVPLNISQKGLEDLERLERLKQRGAISEGNYIVMRTRICNSSSD